jgi:ferredoxin
MSEKKYPINKAEVEIEYQELAAHMNFGGSKYLPRIMKKAFSLEQAKLALNLDLPAAEAAALLGITKEDAEENAGRHQSEALSRKLGITRVAVEDHIRYMFELGFAFPTKKGWRWARTADQAKDSQSNPKFDAMLGDEYFDLWEAFMKIEAYPTSYLERLQANAAAEAPPHFRIIPARKSLQGADVIPEDDITAVLKLYSTIAVEHCPCKRLVRDRGCHSPTEVCLIMDRVAEHNLRRGAARVIDIEEALSIHDKATAAGLICMPQSNEARPTRLTMICHCHWCCCDPTASTIALGFPLKSQIASSCYQAVVDPSACIGCQTCIAVCQFGAIEMQNGDNGKHKARVNPDKCFGCGLCVLRCPKEARAMKAVKTGDSIPKKLAAPTGYTEVQAKKSGKHVDSGSVMARPDLRK